MTDSGFSSAASNRSASSIQKIEPGKVSSSSGNSGLPKPSAFMTCRGRPIIPHRSLYGHNNGGYSPGIYSPKESMSPMSSLAYEFRDLNTSLDANTPIKRLSLSSVSSLDSPSMHAHDDALDFGWTSPAVLTSPVAFVKGKLEGCFVGGSPLSQVFPDENNSEKKFVRKFRSMTSVGKLNSRFLARAQNIDDKENCLPKKQTFTKYNMDASPGLNGGASPFSVVPRRRLSGLVTSPLTSSPMPNFNSMASAFTAVNHDEEELEDVDQEELCKIAEDRLKSASTRRRDGTPEKSQVPVRIASLTARPSSAVPLFRHKSSPSMISPIRNRANKRSLDSTNTSFNGARKRVKCEEGGRRKMAFLCGDRKVKSADAVMVHSSPISSLKSSFRPISAPAQLLYQDDDTPLTHSRLCSTNDSDDDVIMTSEHDRSDADERLLEAMLSENVGDLSSDVNVHPSGMTGLLSNPLLLSMDTSLPYVAKPRELFRSPSAPPVVSSRTLLSTRRAQINGETPVRRRTAISEDIRPIPELVAPSEEEGTLNRSRSFNDIDVMRAVDLGSENDNLIGDFSRSCSLDTIRGKHQDLKYISPETLLDLIDNKLDVGCFEIIDCRYPYEYDGGHVLNAKHIWQEEQLHKRFFNNPQPIWAQGGSNYKPPVLVFYCEFSSERGPRMARAIRNRDRQVNQYPHLHYPEVYVLKDGYKNFFHSTNTQNYCDPPTYRPMAHQNFTRELRICRTKSKAWAGEKTKCGLINRLKHL